ncbi:MAG: GntP family permease [Parasporobacterium sp.]|nr:GntP family permease [Parasporobacterium sp.]
MTVLSLTGIFAGLILMIFLTYRGHSIIWVAPLCTFLVVLFSLGAGLGDGRSLLTAYTVDYMTGVGNYFISWFPIFLLGAIFGKLMDLTGSAKELADVIVGLVGSRFVVLAVLIPCIILTYGGVSLFVVVFIMYPMGSSIYRAANLPRTLLPPAIAFGSFGITMTCFPGSPQIQNLIPTNYFGTTASAGPLFGIITGVLTGIAGYLYLDSRVRWAQKEGLSYDSAISGASVFSEDQKAPAPGQSKSPVSIQQKARMICRGLLPLVVVFVTLNLLKWEIVVSLIAGILACGLLHLKQIRTIPAAFTEGAKSSVTAMMNSACAVGFGTVIRIVPGFALLTGLLTGNITSPLKLYFSEALSVGVLSAATGSSSGGLSIALEAFSDQYLQLANTLQVSPGLLHRIAAIASGCLDKLPHNGAVITLLIVSQCTHKESYKDIFIVSVLIPTIILCVMLLVYGLF